MYMLEKTHYYGSNMTKFPFPSQIGRFSFQSLEKNFFCKFDKRLVIFLVYCVTHFHFHAIDGKVIFKLKFI